MPSHPLPITTEGLFNDSGLVENDRVYTRGNLPKEAHAQTFKSEIIHGDALHVLDRQPDGLKFDVVIGDPPYNIGKNFGNNRDSMPIGDYVEWSTQWIARCLDLLTDNGVMYIYGFPEILARVAAQYPIEEQRWLAWHYTNKAVPSSRFWQRSHESILCLWKPGCQRPALEVDQIREPYTETFVNNCAGKPRKATVSRFGGDRGRTTTYNAHEAGALPRDVFKIPALAGGAGAAERWFMCRDCGDKVFSPSQIKHHRGHNILKHPTQKPLELARRFLLSRINGGGGRVLIPFAGSGSECVAARQMEIDYLGIEINPEYVNFAREWLKQTAHV